MKPHDRRAINARLDILGIALVELARSLPAEEARRVADAVRVKVGGRVEDEPLDHGADMAAAADLAPILAALARQRCAS